MATTQSIFGTDGIRAEVGQWPLIPDVMMKIAYSAGKVLCQEAKLPRVVIGKDTRRSGDMIESALQAGFTAAGVDVYRLGAMPTPGIAYLTRAFGAQAGIVISASHNPYYDNGIKFFDHKGEKLSVIQEQTIEALTTQSTSMEFSPESIGRIHTIDDAQGRYIEFCKASAGPFLNLHPLKLVVDCAHGAGFAIAPKVFRELGAEVIAIGNEPDGININRHYGSTHPGNLQQAVIEHQADLGIALDGDADRVLLVGPRGQLIDGDQILYILATAMQDAGKLKTGGVVGTLMSNLGLEHALKDRSIPFVRTAVGDRNVMQELRKRQWHIGGESSGHIIWLHSTTTGDAIVSALQVLSIMQETGHSIESHLSGLTVYPQTLINLAYQTRPDEELWKNIESELAQKAQAMANSDGRILVRPSGTEPLIRVMVESSNAAWAQSQAEQTIQWLEQKLSQIKSPEKV